MKNSNKIITTSIAYAAFSLSFVNAQTTHAWDYQWNVGSTLPPGTNNIGGNWNSVEMSMGTNLTDNGPIGSPSILNDYTWNQNTSFSMQVEIENVPAGNVDGLFLVITNSAAAPDSADADWTALYLDGNGNLYAAPYANNPFLSHTFQPFLVSNYMSSAVGAMNTYSFNFSQSDLSTLGIGTNTASWEGFGYPFDNDGDTTGNSTTPYRMGLWGRSYLDGAMTSSYDALNNKVSWDILDQNKIGAIDLVDDFEDGPTVVPEPSNSLLFGLGALGLLIRRKR